MNFSNVSSVTIPEGDVLRIEKQRLPLEYVEVEYLQSDGTQYIDTGVYIDDTCGYEAIAQSLDNRSDTIVFGTCGSSNGASRWALNFYLETISMPWNLIQIVGQNDLSLHRFRMNYFNDRKRFLDDTEVAEISNKLESAASEYTVLIFAGHWRNNTASLFTKAKLYSLIITRNTEVIKNFIPCYRKSDRKPGMFDLVSNEFYINQGLGDFVKGRDSCVLWDSEDHGYQVVQYLETHGNEYIDTGVSLVNGNIKVETDIVITSTSMDLTVFGSNGASYYHLTPFNSRWYFGTSGSENSGGTYYPVIDDDYHIVFNDGGSIVINDESITTGKIFMANGNLYINKRFNSARTGRYKFKTFIVSDENKTLRNFIPCYRKSDNKPGMYDTVNGVFYTNSGSGEFTLGPDVPGMVIR